MKKKSHPSSWKSWWLIFAERLIFVLIMNYITICLIKVFLNRLIFLKIMYSFKDNLNISIKMALLDIFSKL